MKLMRSQRFKKTPQNVVITRSVPTPIGNKQDDELDLNIDLNIGELLSSNPHLSVRESVMNENKIDCDEATCKELKQLLDFSSDISPNNTAKDTFDVSAIERCWAHYSMAHLHNYKRTKCIHVNDGENESDLCKYLMNPYKGYNTRQFFFHRHFYHKSVMEDKDQKIKFIRQTFRETVEDKLESIVIDYGYDGLNSQNGTDKTEIMSSNRPFSKQKQVMIEEATKHQIDKINKESIIDALDYAFKLVRSKQLNGYKTEIFEWFKQNEIDSKREDFINNILDGCIKNSDDGITKDLQSLYMAMGHYAEYKSLQNKLSNANRQKNGCCKSNETKNDLIRLNIKKRNVFSDKITLEIASKNDNDEKYDDIEAGMKLSHIPNDRQPKDIPNDRQSHGHTRLFQ